MVHVPNEAHVAKTTLFKPFILAASQLVIFIGFDEHIFVLNIIFFSLLVYNRLKLKIFKKAQCAEVQVLRANQRHGGSFPT